MTRPKGFGSKVKSTCLACMWFQFNSWHDRTLLQVSPSNKLSSKQPKVEYPQGRPYPALMRIVTHKNKQTPEHNHTQ